MTTNMQPQKVAVRGELPTDAQTREFILHYLDKIHPKLDEMTRLDQRQSALHLLLDSGSENSAEEKAAWNAEYADLVNKLNAFRVDPTWTADVEKWGKLAGNLKGELPDYARLYAKEWDLDQFPPEMKAKLDEVQILLKNYRLAINQTEASKGIPRFSSESVRIVREFKSGKISFTDAQAQLNQLNREVGYKFVGAETAQSHGIDLNRMAILRTEMAKAKGFKTWADYQLQVSGQGYTPEYRGTENQRKFLRTWIALMKPKVKAYYEMRLKEMGLEHLKDTLLRPHLSLLTPPDLSLMQANFPADKITTIWEETMLESGFKNELLGQIIFDDEVRAGKNPTGAYMSATIVPAAAVRVLDLQTLNFDEPKDLKPGLIYIMQTFRGAGISDIRTAFHEGMGHALEYLVKGKDQQTSEGYGYVETPSTTAEYFMRDPEYLFQKARPVDGKRPTLQQISEWVKNSQRGEALSMLYRAGSALYDLDLWDYDYTQANAMTYMQRVEAVSKAIDQLSGAYPTIEVPEAPSFYHYVSTPHFISGNVRNIGYSYAAIASQMMHDYIVEQLQKRSGRSSLYIQPSLASILTDDFYKVGWKTQFPANIEQITGKKFDMPAVLEKITKVLTDDCEDCLK
jgi:hypothetical protein